MSWPVLQMLNILNRNWFIIVKQNCAIYLYYSCQNCKRTAVKQNWKIKFWCFTQCKCLVPHSINHLSLQLNSVKRIWKISTPIYIEILSLFSPEISQCLRRSYDFDNWTFRKHLFQNLKCTKMTNVQRTVASLEA